MIRQANFASRAWLNRWISLSLNPPSALGFVSWSHATQQIFFSPSTSSHQNLVSTDWILLHRLTGSWKHDMEYVGTALRTAFNIVSLPALDSLFVDQLTTLCRILSTMEVNKSFFLFPKCSGNPRYLPSPPSFEIPKIDLVFSLTAGGVLLENGIEDLFFCSEAFS